MSKFPDDQSKRGSVKGQEDTPAVSPDFDSIRSRYRQEQERRIHARPDKQYQQASVLSQGEGSKPDSVPHRAARSESVDVLVIGAGFGGLIMASRLRDAGINDFLILDIAGDFGGTWFWNDYPGAACDIESYIYMPFLEETGYIPSLKYSYRSEIFEHCQRVGRHLDLYGQTLFRTKVTKITWDEPGLCWVVSTDRGDVIRARFVCGFTGPFSSPKLPAIPGLDSFQGRAFHTSHWDYDYTGGGPDGQLEGLREKRVGLIGTGATAVQCVSHLGDSAEHLYVFQRTPSAVDARNNRPTDPNWVQSLEPGWQQKRMENFNDVVVGLPVDEDLVDDGWTHLVGRGIGLTENDAERQQMHDYTIMAANRARIDSLVDDPVTAESLKPYYNQMCKRPCFNDNYLQTFNNPNVTLIDTVGKGIERFTSSGVIANGTEYKLDCMVFATGFEWQNDFESRSGFEIRGRGGIRLSDKWKHGLSSLFGVHMSGFPNLLLLTTSQQITTANYTHTLSEIATHNTYVIKTCLQRGIEAVEPTQNAESDWVDHVMSFADARRRFEENCLPGFYNNEGTTSTISIRNGIYAGPSPEYFRILAKWRLEGSMAGLKESRVSDVSACGSK